MFILDVKTLNNIQLQDIMDFFKLYDVPNRTVRFKANTTPIRFLKALDIIRTETSDEQGSFTINDIDAFLFNQLFYVKNNYHFVYKYNECAFTKDSNVIDVERLLSNDPALKFNKLVPYWSESGEKVDLCTTRIESDPDGKLKSILLLLKIDTISGKYGLTHVFCSVTIDVVNEVVLIKFDHSQFEDLKEEPLVILESLKNTLSGLGAEGNKFLGLNLSIISLNKHLTLKAIYMMFKELSNEAESILKSKVNKETEDKIIAFINSISLKEVKQEYIEQVKAVIYQDISSNMKEEIFRKGWVFRFHFREGDHTRATSKQDKRQPVYSSKTFWQLKELIHSEEEMYEAGFHWNLNETPGDEKFVDVRVEQKNGTMILHYYYQMRVDRKEKEDFVIRKIASYI